MAWRVVTTLVVLAAGMVPSVGADRLEAYWDGSPTAVRPVPGPVERPFDPPEHPYGPGHRGVDLAAEPGEPVRAVLPGHVHFAGEVAGVGWVSIDHGAGVRTTYGDLDPRLVSAGQQVQAGAVLGEISAGATHLDWGAIADGGYIDPMSLLGAWEVRLVAPRGQ